MVTTLVATVALAVLAGLSSTTSAMASPTASPAPKATPSTTGDSTTPKTFPTQEVCGRPAVGAASCASIRRTDVAGPLGLLPAGQTPIGYGRADLLDAYDLPSTGGTGMTIAIIDAFDDPNAEADLAIYREQYGLPPCTTANGCFRKVDQHGGTDYPVPDFSWAEEVSIDLDAASAICPACNLLLVEANDALFSNLFAAAKTATDLGAKVVSQSFEGPESPANLNYDQQVFDHPGVAFTAASGDFGYGAVYPAASPFVTAVGGTTLNRASNSRGWVESAWTAGGSGCSVFEPKPSFQTDTGCSTRTIADVAAIGNPQTGIAIYDSFNDSGWLVFGGTSVATPIIAGIYALAGQPGTNDHPVSYPYSAHASQPSSLNDVTTGSNGACGSYLCTAGPGYDGPTGLGTPEGLTAFTQPGPHGDITGTVTDANTGQPIANAQVVAGAASAVTSAQGTFDLTLPVGSYSMSVAKFGYGTLTASGVTVTDGGNTVKNFALVPQPTVTVSGTVTDGSGHGWPLYAKVEASGIPVPPVFTNPVTGAYQLTIPANASYTLRVTAQSNGYEVLNEPVSVGSSNVTENMALLVDPTACVAPGYRDQYLGLANEPFDSGTLPTGWTLKDNTGGGNWAFNDPGARGNLTGGSGKFAILDSDHLGPNNFEDAELITPTVDLTNVTTPTIGFNTDFMSFSVSIADVDLSIDGGTSWSNVWEATTTPVRGPTFQVVNIPQAAGQSNVKVRFRYRDNWGFWWEVDNVYVGQRACGPIPGGLVAGQITDANTNGPVDGATVASVSAPSDTAKSAATPNDPAVDEGYYSLFSSLTGTRSFTASKSGYQNKTASVNVVANAVTEADFALPAGHIVVTSGDVIGTQAVGSTTTHPVKFTNDGTAAVSVSLSENGGSSFLTQPSGAPVARISGHFDPHRAGQDTTPVPRPADSTPAADPWVPTADFPTEIMDNAMAMASDGKVYSFGGVIGLTGPASSMVYDPSTQHWSPIAEMTTQRDKASVAYIGGKFYVTGGWSVVNGAPVASTEIYNPATNTWTTGANNPRPHAATAVTVVGTKFYLVGGCDVFTCGNGDVMGYDTTTNSWTLESPYPEATAWAGCGNLSGQVVCGGGTTDFGDTDHAYSYDPASNAWTQIADMPMDLWGMSAVAANGVLVFSGGVTGANNIVTNQGFAYDPATEKWGNVPNAERAVYRAGSACGFFTVGGAVSGFNAVAQGSLLPGLDNCDGTSNVTWLSESGTSFTVQPGETVTITATFNAGTPTLHTPGAYSAKLDLNTNSPYPVSPVGLTMNVTAPTSWSQVIGNVSGIDCSGKLVALAGASVQVSFTGVTFTIKTDRDSNYGLLLATANGQVTFTASLPGWETETVESDLSAGQVLITILLSQQSNC